MTPSMPVGTVGRDRPADILSLVHAGFESASKPINRRSHAKGHGENLFVHEGPRRAAKNTFLSAKDAENSEDLWELSCVNALASLILFPQIAVQAKVNAPRAPSRFPDCGRPGDLPYSRSTPYRGAFDSLLRFRL